MKKILTYITVFVLGGITIFAMCFFFEKPYGEKRISESINTIIGVNSEKVLVPGDDICSENHDVCIQKINDKMRFSNNITARDHIIETGSGGEKVAVINFPAFSDRTINEKEKIFQKIKQTDIKILAIGMASKYEDYSTDIRLILKEIAFNDLRIRIYEEPNNLIEIFDSITWKKDPKMKLSLEFYNLNLPEYLKITDYMYMIDKMIGKNNGDMRLASFSLVFIPLFAEFNGITNMILYPNNGRILKNISTNTLRIIGMHITKENSPGQTSEYYTSRIRLFLESSPIPNIFIDTIASKQNSIITLYGF